MSVDEKSNDDKLNKLISLLEDILNFKKWMFRRTYSKLINGVAPMVIYNSQLCRVKFVLETGERYQGSQLSIYYGRLHASNDNFEMIFNGENCHCWHQAHKFLDFLDGLSPQESVYRLKNKDLWPQVEEEFRQSDIGRNLQTSNHPEWSARMHSNIWEYYGNRFFELFDLNNPSLWERLVHFNREYHKIYGSTNWVIPPLDKIC